MTNSLARSGRGIGALTLAGVAVTLSACQLFDPEADLEAEFAAANRAVDRWVAAHPTGWDLTLTGTQPLARPEWSEPCDLNPPSGFVTLRHAAPQTEIDLHFRCPLDGAASVQDLQAAFSHAVLQALPHGIRSAGWEFHILPPSSGIEEGVTFSAGSAGRVQARIETPLYAVYGHSVRPSCQPPADAPSREGCYLRREHRVPLRLQLSVPYSGTALG